MSNTAFTTKDVTLPKDGMEIVTNSYWVCENGDPAKALFFGSSRQCNRDRRISDHVISTKLYQDYSTNLSVVFIPVAYVPQRDY